MKHRVKNIKIVSGKAKVDSATGNAMNYTLNRTVEITLRKQDSLMLEGMVACKGKNPIGDFAGEHERSQAIKATIKQHSIEPVGVFKDGVLWHVMEFQDEDAGHSCEFSGVEGVITFGPVPKPSASEEPE